MTVSGLPIVWRLVEFSLQTAPKANFKFNFTNRGALGCYIVLILLGVPIMLLEIFEKNHFYTAALGVVKASADVENETSRKKSSTQVVTASHVDRTVKLYLGLARTYVMFICNGLSARCLWKSDLVKGLASYDYCVFFELPKEQASSCYGCLFNRLSVRGWFAKELRL